MKKFKQISLFLILLFPYKEITALTLGNPDTNVKIEYHFAFSCASCRMSFKEIFLPLKRDFIDKEKVKFVFKEHAMHVFDLYCLILLELIEESRRYDALQKIFSTTKFFYQKDIEGLQVVLAEIGEEFAVEPEDFKKAITSKANKEKVLLSCQNNLKSAIDAIPQIVVNGKMFDGKYEDLKILIENILW